MRPVNQTPKSTPGHKPMLHFASELFTTHPRFIQLKSILMDFFNGEIIDHICLPGLEHVISITLGPAPATLSGTEPTEDDTKSLPLVHIRAYTVRLLNSGTRVPRVELTEMGPSLDLRLRRTQAADAELWKQAMRRPKLKKTDVEKGLGKRKKNLEVDDMGDLRGRVHVGKQDLGRLQTRKMKGLKAGFDEDEDVHMSDGEGGDEEPSSRKKPRRAE